MGNVLAQQKAFLTFTDTNSRMLLFVHTLTQWRNNTNPGESLQENPCAGSLALRDVDKMTKAP